MMRQRIINFEDRSRNAKVLSGPQIRGIVQAVATQAEGLQVFFDESIGGSLRLVGLNGLTERFVVSPSWRPGERAIDLTATYTKVYVIELERGTDDGFEVFAAALEGAFAQVEQEAPLGGSATVCNRCGQRLLSGRGRCIRHPSANTRPRHLVAA